MDVDLEAGVAKDSVQELSTGTSLHCHDDCGSDPHHFPFILHCPSPDNNVIPFLIELELYHVTHPKLPLQL